ncbi:MAG: hypothetical protein ACOZBL_03730, partial [Patescibacteria group bacterium]
ILYKSSSAIFLTSLTTNIMTENKEYINHNLKVFLVDIALDSLDEQELKYRMIELENLANTYG